MNSKSGNGSTVDVSVLVPCYNIEAYGGNWNRMVKSVLQDQPGVNVELVLIDNGSDDNTKSIIKSLCDIDDRVVMYGYRGTGSQGRAWNKAAKMASGRYHVKCVARAWFEPHALSRMAKVLDDDGGIGFTYGKTHTLGAHNHVHDIRLMFDPEYHKARHQTGLAYMYRAEAVVEHGLKYTDMDVSTPDGVIGIPDRDFALQMIFLLEWKARPLDIVTLNYWLDKAGQTTHLLQKHADAVNAKWHERWPDVWRPGHDPKKFGKASD